MREGGPHEERSLRGVKKTISVLSLWFETSEEIDELVGGDLGFYEVAVGLMFDVGANIVALLEIGRNDDFCVHFWSQARVPKRS